MHPTDETELHATVGEIMVLSARVESCLESCIAACLPGAPASFSQSILRRVNFAHQLAILHEVSQQLYDRHDTTLVEFRRWLRRLGRIRQRRNDLVHNVLRAARSTGALGRWMSQVGYVRHECAQAPYWAGLLRSRLARILANEHARLFRAPRSIANVPVAMRAGLGHAQALL